MRKPSSLVELVHAQWKRDQAIVPFLRARKLLRMRRSPHAFLRGTAPFFYSLVHARRALEHLRGRHGWICGDLHVENFGVFSTDAERVVFAVNDFDDAVKGPLSLDVLRLTTSLLLATRGLVNDGILRLGLADRLLSAYEEAFASGKRITKEPRFVRQLRERTKKRRGPQLVAERTEGRGKDLRFIRGDRYQTLAPSERSNAREAFATYAAETLHSGASAAAKQACEIVDIAYRVAGTGSLGAFRVAVLTRGRKGHAPWLFDMKEEQLLPGAAEVAKTPKGSPSARVVAAVLALQEAPPAGLGTTRLGDRSMLVRRLTPQEDKLSLDDLVAHELESVVPYLGSVAGEMHRRGALDGAAGAARLDRRALLDEASEIAGLHETAHLLYLAQAAQAG